MKKTLLITGASSGIGNAAARLLAREGWNVVATMRDPAAGADLAQLDGVFVTRLDVQDPDSIAAAIAAGIARFGRIDALVNNAGYGLYGLFEVIPAAAVRQQFEVNVFGPMNTIRAILPHFRANMGGAIINVSSGAGVFTLPLISLYCASKFALEGFTESLSYELASQNIAVKLVIPFSGVTSTSFNERSAKDFVAADPALVDYDAFVERTNASFARMRNASSISADDVAKRIQDALVDPGDRLRYLIGDDSRGFVKARREQTEDGYMDFMRAYFKN